jgi:hypothetical protein
MSVNLEQHVPVDHGGERRDAGTAIWPDRLPFVSGRHSGLDSDKSTMPRAREAISPCPLLRRGPFAPHVRVNCIAPGLIETEWERCSVRKAIAGNHREHSFGQAGQPERFGNVAYFLLVGISPAL